VAVYALLALLAAGAALAAVLLLSGASHRHPASGGGSPGSVVQLHGIGDVYSNPGHPDTHADTAASATDGSPSTAWMTQMYGNTGFGGYLTGLGLVLDARSSVKLTHLTVTTPTPGFTAEIQSGDSSTGPFTADSSPHTVNDRTTFTLDGKTGRYYVVWITQLPSGGHAEISEVTATR
jgi:hypothetical protein